MFIKTNGGVLLAESTTSGIDDHAFLRANNQAYEWLSNRIPRASSKRAAEGVLRSVRAAASFAGAFHPGRFADGAIENAALEVGAELKGLAKGKVHLPLVAQVGDSRRRVVHVASHVRGIGGHTRMLHHWVVNDAGSRHSVVVIDQGELPIPTWLCDAIVRSGGRTTAVPSGFSLSERAQWLREVARQCADLIVLHHDGHDPVPTVAFAVPGSAPVVLLNHADHQFWLGSSVSDLVINLRTAGSEHTAQRRFVSSNTVLPIPLASPSRTVSRAEARRALSIPEDQLALLCVGRAEKFHPCGGYSFPRTAATILDRQPRAHLYAVGESRVSIAPLLTRPVHERLHFVGSMEDTSLYLAAADLYLETFPFGSQTAVLEAALAGLPIVPAYAPLFPLLVANDDALLDLIPNAASEQEYVEQVDRLIQLPKQRAELGRQLQQRVRVDHVGNGWSRRLARVYEQTDRLTHRPGPIPNAECSSTTADVGLSFWHVVADGRTYGRGGSPNDSKRALLCHASYVARIVGNFPLARRRAMEAVWQNPGRWSSWRLLGVSLLGRAARYIRTLWQG